MTTVGLALLALIQKSLVVSFRAREQMTCSRMVQTGFSRLKNIDFYYLFADDSSQANYGLQAAYPYKAVLDGLKASLQASKFDRFRVQVTFMRRDASDSNSDGLTSDLVAFKDSNSDNRDDYDTNIRYYDQNGDGDFYDTYAYNGRTVAEQPDTHIKKITLDIFRAGRLACTQTELISLEQLTGDSNPSSEAQLALLISTPSNGGFLYSWSNLARQNAWNLAISKPYPEEIARYRADSTSPMPVAGETDALATVNLYMGASGILASPTADASRNFSAAPSALTSALVEGANVLLGQATKDGYTSPITQRSLILDLVPPVLTGPMPLGATPTKSPYVAAALSDTGASTTTSSGICPDVITMKINGSEVNTSYAAGAVIWIDSTTGTVPVLENGAYTVLVEAGDYAGYKTTHSWTFTLAAPVTDNSAPTIAQKSPIGGSTPSTLPEISVKVFDNQSGIIPSSIILKIDGTVVVDVSNIGAHYDAGTTLVSYTPSSPFISGSWHSVEITASHWATDPADKVTSTDTWGFTVP
jgi:hypothetical protein